MLPVLPGVVAVLLYIAATAMQAQNILKGQAYTRSVKILGGIAVICHGLATYQDFFGSTGTNLGIYPMLSLMSLSIVAIVIISSFRRPIENLFVVLFPLAIATVLAELFLTGNYTPREEVAPGIAGHIILSVIAYSLLTIAAAQALLLSFGDSLMRHHQVAILRNLPPLETMEQLMFEMIWIGLVFLTLSIASGFIYIDDFSGPGIVHHTAITFFAWLVFMVLLWGRLSLGWRGAIASRWALSGFVLLAIGYFGSKLVLEVILGRV